MPGRGRLTIRAEARPPVDRRSDLADTGVGMDPEALARMFEPYFSTKATGTGLGLTIAKRNIELNGGTISVTSTRGVGTTVHDDGADRDLVIRVIGSSGHCWSIAALLNRTAMTGWLDDLIDRDSRCGRMRAEAREWPCRRTREARYAYAITTSTKRGCVAMSDDAPPRSG